MFSVALPGISARQLHRSLLAVRPTGLGPTGRQTNIELSGADMLGNAKIDMY